MKASPPEQADAAFQEFLKLYLNPDIVIRPSYGKGTYPQIHSFQWKSTLLHTYSIRQNTIESTNMITNFEVPLFSRSIAIESGDIYLTGGQLKNIKEYLNMTFKFDQGANTFFRKADMTWTRGDHALAYSCGFIYAVGACMHNRCFNMCEKYDVVRDKWVPIAPMAYPRGGAALCVFDNEHIFVFGGKNDY